MRAECGRFVQLRAPAWNFTGADSFLYLASDGLLETAAAAVSITVDPVNDPPSFSAGGVVTVKEDFGRRQRLI